MCNIKNLNLLNYQFKFVYCKFKEINRKHIRNMDRFELSNYLSIST